MKAILHHYDILSPFYITSFSSLSCLLGNILNLNTKPLILFKISYQLIFDLAAIEAQNTTACTVRLKKAGKS